MAKNLPQKAKDQSEPIGNMAEMAARGAQFAPPRPLVPVDGNPATMTAESMPHTPAEQAALPKPVTPDIKE